MEHNMDGFLSQAKAGAKALGDAAQKGALKTKLSGEIMYLKNKVENLKKDFGVVIFDHMRAGEQAVVQQFLQQFEASIGALEKEIQAKQDEINVLDGAGGPPEAAAGGPP